MKRHEIRELGGPGSGYHGHAGRPGKRGGSSVGKGGGSSYSGEEIATFAEIREQAKQSGVKIFAIVKVTYDDVIYVGVKKLDFLRQISDWDGADQASTCQITEDGSIMIG